MMIDDRCHQNQKNQHNKTMAHQAKFEDSNIALIGTDENIALRVQAAHTEDQWKHAGEEDLQVWRIEQFHVVPVPKNQYGTFENGDSYIVLKTIKSTTDVTYDIHFWIGKNSSQDEYGTAAYKASELDDYFEQKPIIHREVEGNESKKFRSYFKQLIVKEGGVASGFRHVLPTEQSPVLYHVKGKKNLQVTQIPKLDASLMNNGDVYVLDLGLQIYIWKGSSAAATEKFKAAQVANSLKDERGKATVFDATEEASLEQKFFSYLEGDAKDVKSAEEGGKDDAVKNIRLLYRLSDEDGTLKFAKVEEGAIHKKSFNESDVYIADLGAQIFVWVGKSASLNERKNAIHYAHTYLVNSGTNPNRPFERVFQGVEPDYMLVELK
jgi:gelsolin